MKTQRINNIIEKSLNKTNSAIYFTQNEKRHEGMKFLQKRRRSATVYIDEKNKMSRANSDYLDDIINRWFGSDSKKEISVDLLKNDFRKTLIEAKDMQSQLIRLNSEYSELKKRLRRRGKKRRNLSVPSCLSHEDMKNGKCLIDKIEKMNILLQHTEMEKEDAEICCKVLYDENMRLKKDIEVIQNTQLNDHKKYFELKETLEKEEDKKNVIEKMLIAEKIQKENVTKDYDNCLKDVNQKEKKITHLMYENNRKEKEGYNLRKQIKKENYEKCKLLKIFKSKLKKLNQKEKRKYEKIKKLCKNNENVKLEKEHLLLSHKKMKTIIERQQSQIAILENSILLLSRKKLFFCF